MFSFFKKSHEATSQETKLISLVALYDRNSRRQNLSCWKYITPLWTNKYTTTQGLYGDIFYPFYLLYQWYTRTGLGV